MTTNSRSRSRRRARRQDSFEVDGFVEVRRNGRLLCRFDPARDLLEIKPRGGQAEVVDLRPLRASTVQGS